MEEQQEQVGSGISIKEIFRTVWIRKWVALAVAIALFLVGLVSIFYGYNPSKKYYQAEFSLNLPGSDGTAVYIYPDGTLFHYTDMVSRETLEAVKGSNADFSGIDVDKMAIKGNISISRNTVTTEKSSETYYTLSVKASYFSNAEQAKNFLTSLANTSIVYLSRMKINYDIYLAMADDTIDYETEIEFLKDQLEVLQREYDSLILTYGGNFVGNTEGKSLLSYSQEVKAYLESGVLDNLLSQLRANKYIKHEDCVSYYKDMIKTLQREYDIKKAALDTVLNPEITDGSGSSVIIDVDASVLQMSKEVAELDDKIKALKAYDGATVKEGLLDEAYARVSGLTDTFTSTCKNVYEKASSAVFTQPGIVVSTGGFGLIATVLMSLIVAIIGALVAGYVAGYYKLKASKSAENSVKEEPASTEATKIEAEENKDDKKD